VRKNLDEDGRDALYLDDIAASAALIASYLKGVKQAEFLANSEKLDSVSRRLIVVGEAVKSLSASAKRRLEEEHAEIHWNDIAKLKDKLTHHYWSIDPLQLWEIAKIHVPIVRRAIESLTRSKSSKRP
jgi:uncharacterized protein with HEPN domain